MNGQNYWSEPFKVEIIPVVLSGSTAKYALDKASQTLTEAPRIVGIAHRVPVATGFTLNGNALASADVYDAAFLVLKSKTGNEVLKIPLSLCGVRSGADNNFFRIPEGISIDFRYGKSTLELECDGATISTASGNNEAFELLVFYSDYPANC